MVFGLMEMSQALRVLSRLHGNGLASSPKDTYPPDFCLYKNVENVEIVFHLNNYHGLNGLVCSPGILLASGSQRRIPGDSLVSGTPRRIYGRLNLASDIPSTLAIRRVFQATWIPVLVPPWSHDILF